MENANQPINPQILSDYNGENQIVAVFTDSEKQGLTKREYYAGLAMQAYINNTNSEVFIAEKAVKQADELLKHLEKTKI